MRLIRGETTTASETGGLIWILFYGDFCTVASVFSEQLSGYHAFFSFDGGGKKEHLEASVYNILKQTWG